MEAGRCVASVLWRWDTQWPADTVEFCPLPPYRHLLLCGTYRLVDGQPADVAPEDCRRDGRLHLLDFHRRRELQRLTTNALLDVKWSPARVSGRVLAAAVDARCQLQLFSLLEQRPPQLQRLAVRPVGGAGRLALALDWWMPPAGVGPVRLAVSDSSGAVSVLELAGQQLTVLWTAVCHAHEAWTCGFSCTDSNIVFTGGDDMLFRCYDVRQPPELAVFTNRSHEAGVTAVQSDPMVNNTLRTGSYDEHLYTWDPRCPRRPLQRQRLDGGVWRIKRHPRHPDRLLTACMFGGSHVTDAGGATVASFGEHKSIVYGADWCRDAESGTGDGTGPLAEDAAETHGWDVDGAASEECSRATDEEGREEEVTTVAAGDVAATCSFYDNLLCVWRT